jgi:5'-nucleotidase
MTTPLILLTNDDGVFSPGLKAAAEALLTLGEVLIVAPRYQQTAMSRSLPTGPQVGVIETHSLVMNDTELTVYGTHGSPAQAVQHGILELAKRPVSLCVSGINYGENVGTSISISGTVGAAIQAAAMGVPSLAVSTETDFSLHHLQEYAEHSWEISAYFTLQIAEKILSHKLPLDIALLNVNIPSTATRETEVRVTRQSLQNYYESYAIADRDFASGHRFPYKAAINHALLEPDSDIQAFTVDRVISLTPLSLDWTARVSLDTWYKEFSG